MRIIDLPEKVEISNPVVTIGTFDGVHRAHQTLIAWTRTKARELNGTPVLLTFHPHPRIVLNTDSQLKLITTWEEKEFLLGHLGIEYIIRVPFTKEFALLPPTEYIEQVLVKSIGVKAIIVGYNHRFGYKRQGDVNLLRELGKKHGFEVFEVPRQMTDSIKISSTRIREYISQADIKEGNALLGYPFLIMGTVRHGDKRGTKLGVPTANIIPSKEKLLPPNGVYVARAVVDNHYYNAVVNIGRRPTVDGTSLVVETHLIGQNLDLYGKTLRIYLLDFIRPEQEFASLDSLRQQIIKNINQAKEYLAQFG
ncbi:MAG: bifunctional riboflavin kinase/FAD synthetase [Chlorobi bacterium]|nr:bifunctional riboflavin kinase/FAD synthetase [Chlorobiota bacterium]